ncbi:MAG: O-antigen ligase family protein [Akkermansiaceae bacterium]|jgi:O-antigen ligase|nr:O-antigen ligase family protein [Luteolibacter sp.]
MNKKFIELLVVCILIFAGIWMATSFVSLQEQLQIFGLIAIIALAIITIAYRKVPLDCKIICALILGYAFAGKGFAYITPVEPFYIGEIAWCVGMLGLFYRFTKGVPLFPNKTNVVIFLWMVTVGLFLLSTFKTFGTLAIRDSAIGYYAMFAFYGYAIFRNNDLNRFFAIILKVCIIAAVVSMVTLHSGIYEKFILSSAFLAFYFSPHPDALLPLVCAGAMYGLLEGIRLRSAWRLFIGILLALLVMSSKTAGVFCLFIIVIYFIVIGRRIDLILTSAISAAVAAICLGIIISFSTVSINKVISENEHIQTFAIGNTGSVTAATNTNWRIAWWKIIFEDTINENPMFGIGLGGDISSHFLQSYMRIDLNSEEAIKYARYPHNIVFTVFGRMGFVGLSIFVALLITVIKLLILVTRIQSRDTSPGGKTALLALLIVIAGIANSLVQSTYEVPYGAITHWFVLGYLIAYYQKNRIKGINVIEPHQQNP